MHTPTPLEEMRELLSTIRLSENDRDKLRLRIVDIVDKAYEDGINSCKEEIQALRDRVKELKAQLDIHNEADEIIRKQVEYRRNNPTRSELENRHGRESDWRR